MARNLETEWHKEKARDLFEREFDEYDQAGHFREAELVMQFLLELDRHDVNYKEWNADIKEKVALEKAQKKLMGDDSIFFGVIAFATYWFYQRCLPPDAMPEDLQDLADMTGQMDHLGLAEVEYKQLLGYGLQQIRKKHPAIYQTFKAGWEELLAECTEGLNRRKRSALQ